MESPDMRRSTYIVIDPSWVFERTPPASDEESWSPTEHGTSFVAGHAKEALADPMDMSSDDDERKKGDEQLIQHVPMAHTRDSGDPRQAKKAKDTRNSLAQVGQLSHVQEFTMEDRQKQLVLEQQQQQQQSMVQVVRSARDKLLRIASTARNPPKAVRFVRQQLERYQRNEWLESILILMEEAWFYGFISEEQCEKAEDRLSKRGDPNHFFVRLSLNRMERLTLVCLHKPTASHFETAQGLLDYVRQNGLKGYSRLDSALFRYDEDDHYRNLLA